NHSRVGPYYSDLKYCSVMTALDTNFGIRGGICHNKMLCCPLSTQTSNTYLFFSRCLCARCFPNTLVNVPKKYGVLDGSLGSSQLTVGARVLARREPDGYYYLGTIKHEEGGLRGTFLIQFDKPAVIGGECQVQKTSIFDIIQYSDSTRHSIVPEDKVLAPWEPQLTRYGPGTAILGIETRDPLREAALEDEEITVKFWNGKIAKVPKDVAVWIPSSVFERIALELHMPLTTREKRSKKETEVGSDVFTYRPLTMPFHCCSLDCAYKCFWPWYPTCHSYYLHDTCHLPTYFRHHWHPRCQQWWPLTPKYNLNANNAELLNKEISELKELEAPKKEISSSSSSSSDSDTYVTKSIMVDSAVNTDSSLLEKQHTKHTSRPDWKYWERSHSEPHHKKPGT
uniref:Chromosome 11 open reading frame 16 n=1 Tax=Latimeria chalumnae TaxID=7897 RepID=H3BBY0_LATCH